MTEVVAALIWENGRFLICQRPAGKKRALLWEFVGGKVEPGESREQALIRECREELAVTVEPDAIFCEVVHAYPDSTVHLTLFHAAISHGRPQRLEHNDIRWITPAEIPQFDFCPADREILARIACGGTANDDHTRALALIRALKALYPEAECALKAEGDPFRLLVMARLSAQCTDARVNEVSVGLFERFPTVADMAAAEVGEIEALIRSCGLFRSKAKNIKDMSVMLLERFGGEVPREMDELLSLPGVGRKIANLIRGDVYGVGGIVADTHCIRLCGRFGFSAVGMKDPVKVERILTPLIPQEEQSDFCHRLVFFGREWCMARSPRCGECPLRALCIHPGG